MYNGVLDDYSKITAIESPLELLDKYRIDYVLFPVNRPLTYVLDHSAEWRPIYEDRVAKLYGRAPAAAAPPDSRQKMINLSIRGATTSRASGASAFWEAPEVRTRNFFPFPILWFSIVALEISPLAARASWTPIFGFTCATRNSF